MLFDEVDLPKKVVKQEHISLTRQSSELHPVFFSIYSIVFHIIPVFFILLCIVTPGDRKKRESVSLCAARKQQEMSQRAQ